MSTPSQYAQFLGDQDPLRVLEDTQERVHAIVHELGPEGLQSHYEPGKWTAGQILAHLADCEIAFGFRIRQIISEPLLEIQTFDETNWARRYQMMDGGEAARTFHALRAWNLSLFRLLEKEDLSRVANHPARGPENADTVIRILAGHTLNHLAQLEKVLSTSAR